jgi:hypothetical protein
MRASDSAMLLDPESSRLHQRVEPATGMPFGRERASNGGL